MVPCSIVVVGDGVVGKTCLLLKYAHDKVPDEYVPTVFDVHTDTIDYNGVEVNLKLVDTAGQEDYEKLRTLSFYKCNVFLLCYDVTNSTSLENCKTKWIDELRTYNKKCPIILVGTKMDLLNDVSSVWESANKVAKSIKAVNHILTSSKDGTGVTECFETAIDLVVNKKKKKPFYIC